MSGLNQATLAEVTVNPDMISIAWNECYHHDDKKILAGSMRDKFGDYFYMDWDEEIGIKPIAEDECTDSVDSEYISGTTIPLAGIFNIAGQTYHITLTDFELQFFIHKCIRPEDIARYRIPMRLILADIDSKPPSKVEMLEAIVRIYESVPK